MELRQSPSQRQGDQFVLNYYVTILSPVSPGTLANTEAGAGGQVRIHLLGQFRILSLGQFRPERNQVQIEAQCSCFSGDLLSVICSE